MNLDIIAPAFYPDESYIRYFLASARRHHIPVRYYGLGRPFTHWIDTHITECIDYLRTLRSSHVLFTDAIDVIFLAGMPEILQKYSELGEPPILMAYETSGLNAGGWIAERTAMIEALGSLYEFESGDPQERWRNAFSLERLGSIIRFGLVLDEKRSIFQVDDGSDISMITGVSCSNGRVPSQRIYNRNTGSLPCLLHCAGGGKEERMLPFLKALAYER